MTHNNHTDDLLRALAGAETDTLDELKAAAFEALLLNPGSTFSQWQHELMRNYPTELIDAYGNHPNNLPHALSNLWETEYTDESTGMSMTFKDWAKQFATEDATETYYSKIQH